ncbi:protein GVQW3-like [Mercenaria mercenaria]|uniref:protein GVQW3-like n=1 Tax=Mercenaria mercenaria TaxID=6596 RepID=UPI00234E979D|nr:protein GVQW3-like [Mercenaria mercenaria]
MVATLHNEQRNVIKFCVSANMTPTDTHKLMQKGKFHVSRSLVFKWHKRFSEGLDDVSDKQRTGRPRRSESEVKQVREIISEDRRRSVREISDITGISVTGVHNILTEELGMGKVCALGAATPPRQRKGNTC